MPEIVSYHPFVMRLSNLQRFKVCVGQLYSARFVVFECCCDSTSTMDMI